MDDLGARIELRADELPPAERRIAEVILAEPGAAAFSTVAALGRRAGTSGATVVRLAERLGYSGWSDLQAQVRKTLDQQLRPATERIREAVPGDVLAATAALEADNVRRTLEQVEPGEFHTAVDLLADRRRAVWVLAGTSEAGIGSLAADALDLLRPDVTSLEGSAVRTARQLARVGRGDVVLSIDLRRYERWVLASAQQATDAGAALVAVTDSRISPLARLAKATFVVTAEGAGPFDSHVGTLALVNALTTAVARALRRSATTRLDLVERSWRASDALTDR
jgi:DNA-binding MurR/RpiR family transcriptional regulator